MPLRIGMSALMLCVATPQLAVAGATLTESILQDTTSDFLGRQTGTAITGTETHNFSGGTNWTLSGSANELDLGTFDVLTLTGSLLHTVPPTGPANTDALNFNFVVNGTNFTDGAHMATQVIDSTSHGADIDSFTADLDFTVVSNHIVDYRLTVDGAHATVPEPSSMVLAGMGLLATGIAHRRRRKTATDVKA